MSVLTRSKNMKAIRRRYPDLAQALEDSFASPNPSGRTYEFSYGKLGKPCLTVIDKSGKQHLMHSRYEPEKEAEALIASADLQNPKLVAVMGVGLGYHLRALQKAIENENILTIIFEKDLHLFKEVVSKIDISDLLASEKTAWFVATEESEAYVKMFNMLTEGGVKVQLFLKTICLLEHPVSVALDGEHYVKMMQALRDAAYAIIFNYGNCPEDSMIGVENIMKNLSLIMRTPGIKDLFGVFRGIPGVIVSTGPSLDKNVELLKELHDKALIMAADSSLRILEKKGIVPHMAASIERIVHVATMYKELSDEFKSKIWLAAPPLIRKEAYGNWNGPKIMVYRAFEHFKWINMPKGTINGGPSCSNLAFKTLVALGCDPIILIGQDCAFVNAEKTHAEEAPAVTNLRLNENDLFQVKGAYEDYVWTNQIYNLFCKAFETDIAAYDGVCVDATEGGSFIAGAELMTFREAIDKYCTETYNISAMVQNNLREPTKYDLMKEWAAFSKTMLETETEVERVVKLCDDGLAMIENFEQEAAAMGISDTEGFLRDYPDYEFEKRLAQINSSRIKIMNMGGYFNLYLMHIVQMIIVRYELDFNQIPSLCDDKKRCGLQHMRLMKGWFTSIGGVCKLALDLLKVAIKELHEEFGES
ncbi:MAG: motility associated factor glycosyltransferase family protein [Candidatus Riflebacteria bacterium]|nr:motility associated factor glycosyltransferase family protein [Candidatus Riflebacteria bacterium]